MRIFWIVVSVLMLSPLVRAAPSAMPSLGEYEEVERRDVALSCGLVVHLVGYNSVGQSAAPLYKVIALSWVQSPEVPIVIIVIDDETQDGGSTSTLYVDQNGDGLVDTSWRVDPEVRLSAEVCRALQPHP